MFLYQSMCVECKNKNDPYSAAFHNPKSVAHCRHQAYATLLFLRQKIEPIGDCRMIDGSVLKQMRHTPPLLQRDCLRECQQPTHRGASPSSSKSLYVCVCLCVCVLLCLIPLQRVRTQGIGLQISLCVNLSGSGWLVQTIDAKNNVQHRTAMMEE